MLLPTGSSIIVLDWLEFNDLNSGGFVEEVKD